MEISQLTDEKLIKLYKNGSSKAFEVLLMRYKSSVYKYIYSFLHNRELTEDFFQDTFLKAIQNIQMGKYEDSGKFLSWLKRIAHNLIVDYFWDKNKINIISESVVEYDTIDHSILLEKSIEDVMFNEQVMLDAVRLVDFLPIPQQSVVRMRFFEGMNFNEIAEKDNVSVNTALGRMRYALLNMRRMVNEKEIDLKLK
jgi:RNA polymerase sigma-70 factor (ECF subfamily)